MCAAAKGMTLEKLSSLDTTPDLYPGTTWSSPVAAVCTCWELGR